MSSAPAEPASCVATDVTLNSSNGRLEEVSTGVYESLNCQATESLESQLLKMRNSPELTGTADDELWRMEWNNSTDASGMEYSIMALRDGYNSPEYQACAISVSDSPRTKSVFCFDVTAPNPGG